MYKILEKQKKSELVEQIRVEAPFVAARCRPGQFVIVIPRHDGERVPLTIVDADRKTGSITLIYQIVGRSTQELSMLKAGDFIPEVAGPMGQPAVFHAKERVLGIAGGVGAAPLYPQLRELKKQGVAVDVIIGARTKELLLLEEDFAAFADHVYLVTNDGSAGQAGFVTDVLKELLRQGVNYDEVIAIGPVIMMRAVVEVTKPIGLRTAVSLNPIMIDGTGMCGCCRVKIGGQTKFSCVDGPDFDGFLVEFDELMQRQGFFKEEEHKCKLEEKTW